MGNGAVNDFERECFRDRDGEGGLDVESAPEGLKNRWRIVRIVRDVEGLGELEKRELGDGEV